MSQVPIIPAVGKYTYFLIDLDRGIVVGVWASESDSHTPDILQEARNIARETGRRHTIAKSTIFVEPHPR